MTKLDEYNTIIFGSQCKVDTGDYSDEEHLKLSKIEKELESMEKFWNASIPFLQGDSKIDFITSLMESQQNQRTQTDVDNEKRIHCLVKRLESLKDYDERKTNSDDCYDDKMKSIVFELKDIWNMTEFIY